MVAAKAVDSGDLINAERRFERALEIQPNSSVAKLGLARVARMRADEPAERRWLEEVLTRAPRSPAAVRALRRLVELEAFASRPERALEYLDRALEIDPYDAKLLSLQAELTGEAPSLEGLAAERILELSRRHPFDLGVQLRAAKIQIEAGEIKAAKRLLRSSYWLADLDPGVAAEIATTLAGIDARFAKRKIVPVHVYADQTITGRPGWEMRLRILWRKTSAAFDPLIKTYFVPVSISAFDTTRVGADLSALEQAWSTSQRRWPGDGILVAFTERTLGRRQRQMLGRAELLGRRTIVRLVPEATESRVLIHEVFHLYGGVHVADVVDSLMNPSGDTSTLDPLNAEIITLTRNRGFGPGGERANINPYVDKEKLVQTYMQALRVNLTFRKEGLGRASELGRASRVAADNLIRGAVRLDDHLAQVSERVSQMLVEDRLYAKAAEYNDLAAKLYGEASPKGREQTLKGERLRWLSKAAYSGQSLEPAP
jgi:tetratricopeptide (TPR) repeat protein